MAQAPGSLQAGEQSARTMVYGSSYDENSFQLDGADVNDNFFNESLAEANPAIIAEVEVLSLGAPAEYGNLTGAVYNVVTRQGTNQFHGDVNYYYQSDGLTGTNTSAADDGVFDVIDGMEVLRRAAAKHPGVKVIVLTGHGSSKDRDLCLELGAFAYLEKPVDIEVLADTMRRAQEAGGDGASGDNGAG